MKKLGKVLRTAEISGINKDTALRTFLRVYRETPHSTTKVAPALLLMGYSRSSGLPRWEQHTGKEFQVQKWHKIAQEKDKASNARMKIEYDARMRTRERLLRVGSRVLFKRERLRKNMSHWDPDPFTIEQLNGSLVTASRRYPRAQTVTRNSSFFKLSSSLEDDDEVDASTDRARPLS